MSPQEVLLGGSQSWQTLLNAQERQAYCTSISLQQPQKSLLFLPLTCLLLPTASTSTQLTETWPTTTLQLMSWEMQIWLSDSGCLPDRRRCPLQSGRDCLVPVHKCFSSTYKVCALLYSPSHQVYFLVSNFLKYCSASQLGCLVCKSSNIRRCPQGTGPPMTFPLLPGPIYQVNQIPPTPSEGEWVNAPVCTPRLSCTHKTEKTGDKYSQSLLLVSALELISS